jgi:hypothetical protein
MPNLLKSFRKHRKAWFAILTLMCMLSFVFLPIVLQLDRSRQARDTVVVRSKYGQLRESDIGQFGGQPGQLRRNRQVALQFLQAVSEKLAEPVAKRGQSQDQNRGREALEVKEEIGPIDERDMVKSWLFAQRAKQLGLSMDDSAINAFILRVGEKRLSQSDVQDILRKLHISAAELFDALRDELLALKFQQIFAVSLQGMTPSQRWDSFLRLNRIAKIEAVPVKVEPFVKDVPDPSEAEVRAFFDENKDRDEDPTSIQVGFNQPHKVNIQYFKIEPETSLNLDAVTEEQIKAEYEATKETYKEEAPAETPKPTGQPPAGQPAAAAGPKPAATAKPAEAPKLSPPASAKPETKSAPAAPEKKPETIPPAPQTKESKKTSAVSRGSLFRFIAMDAKDAPAEKKGPVGSAKPIAESPKSQTPAPKAESPIAKPQPDKSPPKTEMHKPPAAAPKVELPALKPGETAKTAVPAKPQYTPLEKVKNKIRREIASRNARQHQKMVVEVLKERMDAYHTERLDEAQKSDTPPAPPDIKAWGKQYGLEVHETGVISRVQARDLDIFQSFLPGKVFVQVAFGQFGLYQPAISSDSRYYYQFGPGALDFQPSTIYLFWKIENAEAKASDLKDPATHALVVEQWKLQKARQHAKEDAERLAEEARQAKKPLRDLFGGKEGKTVIEPPPFTWLTGRSVPGSPLDLTRVTGIDQVGMEFMRSVFTLQPGQVGLAVDQPGKTVYVVRLVNFTPGEETLWRQFAAEAAVPNETMRLREAQQFDQRALWKIWRDDLEKDAGLHWEREPVETRGGGD